MFPNLNGLRDLCTAQESLSHLENLPKVVVHQLLQRLDTSAKLQLRLVCRTTHNWVTTKKFVKNLKAKVTCDEDLLIWMEKHDEEELELNEAWSYFHFDGPLESFDRRLRQNFFACYGNQIEILELTAVNVSSEQLQKELLQTLNQCSGLKALIIHDLCTNRLPEEENHFARNCSNDFLPKLRRFTVHQLSFLEPGEIRVWEHIVKLFRTSLDSITIPKPYYTGMDAKVAWPAVKALQYFLVTEPLLSMLETQKRRVVIDVKHLVPVNFTKIAERCMTMYNSSSCDLYFSNVHANHVKYVFLMTGDDHEEDFLERILTINEKIDDRRRLERWTALEELDIKTGRCDVRNEYEGQLIYPNLRKIRVEFNSLLKDDPELLGLKRVVKLLFQVRRERVEDVLLKWPSRGNDAPESVVSIEEIKGNFPNLKSLVVIQNEQKIRVV